MRSRMLFMFLLTLSFFSGCSGAPADKPDMYSVTGSVTLDGSPLKNGSIVFDTADGKGHPAAGGITDGTFELEATPGAKIVRISAVEETSEVDQYGEKVTISIIPERFNSQSELTADVKASGDNVFTFPVESSKE